MQRPRFITPRAYEARREFIRQCKAHSRDPGSNPKPDHSLRLVDPTHGPITSVRLDCDPQDGEPVTAISYHGRNDRFLDPTDEVAIEVGLAFGGGLSVQDTGSGLGYPRLRVADPKGRIVYVTRVLLDAPPWAVAKQQGHDGARRDYHWLRRCDLSPVSVRAVWDEGKQSRVPWLGRAAFFAAAALYFSENHVKAGIGGPLEDHLALIADALAVGDERHAAYLRAASRDVAE